MNAQFKNMSRNNYISYAAICWAILLFASCKEPEARRPVSVASGSYLKQNIRTAQEILAADTLAINQNISHLNSLTILQSAHGFKYFLHAPISEDTVTPKPGEKVVLTYSISNLQQQILYDTATVGNINYVVDKEKLFEGLREAVKLLPEGQTGTFFFPSALAFGNRGDGGKISPNQPIICTLSLLEIKTEN